MRASGRKPYDIDSLTDIALRVFAEKGYDGASMDDVARAAGITKASIYHHVTRKEALLERGLRRALDALFAILEEPEANSGRAMERVRAIVRRVTEVSLELLPELTVLVRVRGETPVQEEALERRRTFDRHVAQLIETAQRDGDARGDLDPRLATRLIFGMTNSVVEWYRPGAAFSPDAIAQSVQRVVFEGIAAREPSR